jgi:hypothetical protein
MVALTKRTSELVPLLTVISRPHFVLLSTTVASDQPLYHPANKLFFIPLSNLITVVTSPTGFTNTSTSLTPQQARLPNIESKNINARCSLLSPPEGHGRQPLGAVCRVPTEFYSITDTILIMASQTFLPTPLYSKERGTPPVNICFNHSKYALLCPLMIKRH